MEDSAEIIARFFLLSRLNSAEAFQLSQKAFKRLQAEEKISPKFDREYSLIKIVSDLENQSTELKPTSSMAELFPAQVNFDFQSWKLFLQKASFEEITAVLFCNILKLSEEKVARSFSVSVATIRFRQSSGLTLLGKTQASASTGS